MSDSDYATLVVCLNPAVELTYWFESFSGEQQTATEMQVEAGGKGTNVARLLTSLGHRNVLATSCCGLFSEIMARTLEAESVETLYSPVGADTRASLVLITAENLEPLIVRTDGEDLVGSDAEQLESWVLRTITSGKWNALVLSGSVPPGLGSNIYGRLVAAASEAGLNAIVDAGGDLLAGALSAMPFLVKPNEREACSALGYEIGGVSPERLARELGQSARIAIVTCGPEGAWVCSGDSTYRVKSSPVLGRNGAGAGDAYCAEVVRAVTEGCEIDEMLVRAAVMGASAVNAPGSGRLPQVLPDPVSLGVSVESL